MKWLQDIIGNNVYLMHNIKELALDGLSSIEILFWFLHRFPNLEILCLSSSTIKEVFPDGSHVSLEKIGTVVQLKILNLKFSDIALNIGFENSPILQRVEKLCIKECYSTNLIPSSMTFTHLSYLEVSNCNRLRNLLTSSTAKSMVQLTIMKVAQCAMMEEIVTVEENEEEKEDEIVFGKLKSLELVFLRNLTSFSNSQSKLAFRFPSLEKVRVSNCLKLEKFSEKIMGTPNLEKVNIVEGDEGDKWYWEGDLNATIQKIFTDKVLFEFCQNLELHFHPEIQQVWRGEISPPDNCFNNLRTLIVKECSFLSKVFPSRLLPYFKNLEELHASSSPVEVIFDIDGNSLTETNAKPFGLKKLTLRYMEELKRIWSKDPRNTIRFLNLEEMVVIGCAVIKTLLPASLARKLVRLKKLEIGRCDALEEIIGKEEAVADEASIKFEFQHLTTLSMYDLPSLKFFYPGRYTLEFPSLESLCVFKCGKLDTFASDFESHQGCEDEANVTTSPQSLFMAEKVIPNLENLTLNEKDMMLVLSRGHFSDNMLHKVKLLGLHFGDSFKDTLPFKFFLKVPNLEVLKISYFIALGEIFPSQKPDDIDEIIKILSQVGELFVESLPLLSSVGLHNSWVDPVVKNLRVLEISDCRRLTILVPSSAVSFCNLTTLTIRRCHGLVSLFSSSVAKSLVQLHAMEISDCGSITQIVNDGTDESTSDDDIIFERLRFIILSHLPRLVSFYSGNATLEFSDLLFPTIEQCPKLKCFSQGVVRTPRFTGIRDSSIVYGLHKYGDLNTTVQKLFERAQFICGLQDLKLRDCPELEGIWHGVMPVSDGGFNKLKTLIVDDCQFLSDYVIPFHLLGFLSNLEDLQVRNCDSVKAIFDAGSLSSPFSMRLKKLALEQLPGLENIWNENPQEILSFPSLQHVYVHRCGSLKSLFQASMVEGKLECLETLEVAGCDGLVEIVANDETVVRGITSNSIMFPSLTTLHLWNLPQLKCICLGPDGLEWPKLKVFNLNHCDQLRIFPTKGLSHVPVDTDAIVSFEKDFPNLEQLSLNKADVMNINWRGNCEANFIQRVKFLILQCFHEDSDGFPSEFFRKGLLPNLEKLRVGCSKFKEIFSSQRPDEVDLDTDMLFPRLKGLELFSLGHLGSIGLEQSWVAPILENLETLIVCDCRRLRNLVPSAVSFSKLRELHVENCEGMVYLFTLSTARSLVLLEELSIARCASIQEIVSKEGDGSTEFDITFSKLKRFSLDYLRNLGSFYSGNSTMNFPSLEVVIVHGCPRMTIFSRGTVIASQHLPVSTRPTEYTNFPPQHCGLDLNASIALLFTSQEEQLAQITRGMQDLNLENHQELEVIWQGVIPVPDGGFSKLKTVIVDGCQFLSRYVIPFHLVPFLRNLEDLKVRNCDFVKAIFEVGPKSTPFSFPMRSMKLEELPNLEQVWNEDPQESLSFQSLEQVYVYGCRSLKSLFPASIARGKLESLEILRVEICEGLVEIVASEETASEEATRNSIIFPSLTELRLWGLPELICIYSGLNNVEWPKLESLVVISCPSLINLAPSTVSFSNLRELRVSDCDGFLYLFTSSTAKTLALLEHLSLWECESIREIVAKGEDESDEDEITFENLKKLKLHSLPSLDSFYRGTYHLKFPCLEKVKTYNCFQMEVFSHADIYAPHNVTIDSDDDLKDMIEKAFKKATIEL